MSDTKALENNFWCGNCGHRLILHMSGKCVGIDEDNQTCNCQAAADLSQLRTQNAEMREAGQIILDNWLIASSEGLHAMMRGLNAVLAKYPEETK